MEHLVVVTHPKPLDIEARRIEHRSVPDDAVALGYYHEGRLIARGVVSPDALEAINGLLAKPVSLALAAAEDEQGNIDARICLVLPIDPDAPPDDDPDRPSEPWKASVPQLPDGIESAAERTEPETGEDGQPKLALLPIGNVVRSHRERRHPGDVAEDAREMLANLVEGHAQDAVSKAIEDLLKSL